MDTLTELSVHKVFILYGMPQHYNNTVTGIIKFIVSKTTYPYKKGKDFIERKKKNTNGNKEICMNLGPRLFCLLYLAIFFLTFFIEIMSCEYS